MVSGGSVPAIIAGVIIVGGGAIKPMQHRWENWLNTAEQAAATLAGRTSTRTASGTGQYPPAPAQPLYPCADPTLPSTRTPAAPPATEHRQQ